MLTCLRLIFRDFQSKSVGPIRRSEKIATNEAENDNASQTATHVKRVAFALLTSLLQKPYQC